MKTGQRKKRKIDLLFITATISTSLVLFLIGLITFLIFSANKFSKDIREEMSMEIVLNEEIEQSDIAYIRQRLAKLVYTYCVLLFSCKHLIQLRLWERTRFIPNLSQL